MPNLQDVSTEEAQASFPFPSGKTVEERSFALLIALFSVLFVFLTIVTISLIISGGNGAAFFTNAALSVMISLAAMFVGGITGFIFGIPRRAQKLQHGSSTVERADHADQHTNLEDISDWLTKIIVIVGLINIQDIPGFYERISTTLTKGFVTSAYQATLYPYVGCLILYCSLLGFFGAYVFTRNVFRSQKRDAALAAAEQQEVISYAQPDELPYFSDTAILGRAIEPYVETIETLNLNEGLQRSLYWSLRLMQWGSYKGVGLQSLPGYQFTAYGFFIAPGGHYNFGIIVYHSNTFFARHWNFLRRALLGIQHPDSVLIDGHKFPIVYRPMTEQLHGFKCHPVNGTGTCYTSAKYKDAPSGILTAKHVTGKRKNKQIAIACGHTGTVDRLAPEGIDAAIIKCDCIAEHAANAKKVKALQFIPPYIPAEIWGSRSDVIVTRVEHVTDTFNIFSEEFPARIVLADYGVDGDSGGMVLAQGRKPIGIYMGQMKSEKREGGFAQHLFQAADILKVDLYI